MLLTIRLHNPINSPGILLTLALSTLTLGVMIMNPVFADSHATTQPVPSVLGYGYESALTGYKTLDSGERTAWKKSNDTVGKIGGWRSYANEAYQANQAEAKPKKDSDSLDEGTGESLESAVATPNPASSAKRMDPTSVTSDNMDMVPMTETPEARLVKKSKFDPLKMSYQSAMSTYRPYDDNPPGGWRAANNRVGEIGGWRTYAQEAYEANKLKAQTEAESGSPQ